MCVWSFPSCISVLMDKAKEKEEKTVRRKDCLRFQAFQREKRAERSVLGSGEGWFLQLPARGV